MDQVVTEAKRTIKTAFFKLDLKCNACHGILKHETDETLDWKRDVTFNMDLELKKIGKCKQCNQVRAGFMLAGEPRLIYMNYVAEAAE